MVKIDKMLAKTFKVLNKTVLHKVLLGFLVYTPVLTFGQIDFDSYLRVRVLGKQVQGLDQSFATDQSFHLKGTIRPSEVFETHFWFLSYASFGEDLEGSVKLYAFGKLFFSKELSLSLGQISYEIGFHEVMSPNPNEAYPYVLEGLFINYSTGVINLDLFGAYMPKQWVGSKELPRLKYGTGMLLDIFSVSEYLNQFNFHVVYLSDSFFEVDSQKTTRYGVALDGNFSNLNLSYKFVAIAHGEGFKFKSDETMYHLELSYSQPVLYSGRAFFGYHSDTKNYDPWLYNRYENAGLLDLFLWGNLTYYYLGYEASFNDYFDMKIVFHNIDSTEPGTIHLGSQGSAMSKGDLDVSVAGKSIGRELDMLISKDISDELELELLLGFFTPGQSLESFFDESYYMNFKLTGIYKF